MRTYVILKADGSGFSGDRSKGTGPGPPSSGSLVSERLSERDAARLRSDDGIALMCPSMETALPEPLADPAYGVAGAWGIDAVGAGASRFTGAGVRVAVLDTGIDAAHPAFTGVRLTERDFSGHGNGDRNGHGTHCAGTVFGRDLETRIGVARGVLDVLIGKVLGDDGRGSSEMMFQGMQWAISSKVSIVSMSVGLDFTRSVTALTADGWPIGLATSTALHSFRDNLRMFDAIMRMASAAAAFGGAPLIFAATGNSSRRSERREWRMAASLPAAADGVVSVAAAEQAGAGLKVASFSNSLPTVIAPGVGILSARAGGGSVAKNGTSMACPHAAGVAALWWEAIRSEGRRATPDAVRNRLLTAAVTTPFADADENDIGQGLVVSP